eukprot:m.303358 g.303358  ORF g.303358 m.303358 type:complete len:69 (+) comp15892_c1_seq13:5373-5579(+)
MSMYDPGQQVIGLVFASNFRHFMHDNMQKAPRSLPTMCHPTPHTSQQHESQQGLSQGIAPRISLRGDM